MKIALVQSRVVSDRPSENLENWKIALKRPEMDGVDLVVLPSLCLSGILGPVARSRPGLDIQYQKVFQDFLALSVQFPKLAIASSALTFGSYGQIREEAFMAGNGQVQFMWQGEQARAVEVAGQWVGLSPGVEGFPQQIVSQAKVLITLQNVVYQGEPCYPPPTEVGEAWRINVSAIGGHGPHLYQGATCIFDPQGQLKGWATGFERAMLILNTDSLHLPTLVVLPTEPLEVLHQALVTGIHDFVKTYAGGRGGVIVGMSGGLDSSLVTALAVEALGPEQVLGVALPGAGNDPESLTLARELAKNLGISFLTVPIDGVRESCTRSFLMNPLLTDTEQGEYGSGGTVAKDSLAEENIQARIRGVLLMYLANRQERLVLASLNKSETAVGYTTLYGDTCGALAPIGDLYKGRVYELSQWLNRKSEIIPAKIIERRPWAELRLGQKDQEHLPSYPLLDDILYRHLEGRCSGSQVAREGGHSPLTVAWALSALKRSAFKRTQGPLVLVASSCPLSGSDW